jgi:hypothetical protein
LGRSTLRRLVNPVGQATIADGIGPPFLDQRE